MEDTKTLLFYLFGLAGLITLSILFTGRIEPPVEPLPPIPASPTAPPTPAPVPPPISFRTNLIPLEVTGEPLTISGVVYAADRKTPLPGAQVEVWQTNPVGFYDGYHYLPTSFNLGGRMRTAAAGRYEFTTLKPGPLKVGRENLPAQIHFKASYQDQEPLLTHLFFADDPYLNNIPPSPELTIRLDEQVGPIGPVWQGNFDIILPVSPPQP